jgi:hypothetical protein
MQVITHLKEVVLENEKAPRRMDVITFIQVAIETNDVGCKSG